MRDIRDDIRERIAAAEADGKRLETEIEKIINYIEDLKALLEVETARLAANGHPIEPTEKPTEELDKFIQRLVKKQAPTKAEIAAAVQKAGYIKAGQSAGRVVHGKLLGMTNDKILRVRSDKKYEVIQ